MNDEEQRREGGTDLDWLANLPPPVSDEELARREADRARELAAERRDTRARVWREMMAPYERFQWARPEAPELAQRVRPVDAQGKHPPLSLVLAALVDWYGPAYFTGAAGSGKTSLAVAALRGHFERHDRSVLFVPAYKLGVARIQHPAGQGEPDVVRRALKADLLLLDDVGAELQTANNAVPFVLQARHDANRPTWVTTGETKDQLAEKYGAGVQRRITERARIIRCEPRKGAS